MTPVPFRLGEEVTVALDVQSSPWQAQVAVGGGGQAGPVFAHPCSCSNPARAPRGIPLLSTSLPELLPRPRRTQKSWLYLLQVGRSRGFGPQNGGPETCLIWCPQCSCPPVNTESCLHGYTVFISEEEEEVELQRGLEAQAKWCPSFGPQETHFLSSHLHFPSAGLISGR